MEYGIGKAPLEMENLICESQQMKVGMVRSIIFRYGIIIFRKSKHRRALA